MIKVILKEDIKGHGKKGDILEVSDGFGRNFLIPKNKAVAATPEAIKKIETEKQQASLKEEKVREKNLLLKNKIENLKIELKKKAKEGKLFGRVNAKEISSSLSQNGLAIDPKKIGIRTPINRVGTYKVGVTLDKDLKADLTLEIVEE